MLVSTDGRLYGADKSRERDKLNHAFGHGFGHDLATELIAEAKKFAQSNMSDPRHR